MTENNDQSNSELVAAENARLEELATTDPTVAKFLAAITHPTPALGTPAKPTALLVVTYQTSRVRTSKRIVWSTPEHTAHLPPCEGAGKRYLRGVAAGMAKQLADIYDAEAVWNSGQWSWTVEFHRDGLLHRYIYHVYSLTS